MTDIFDAPCIYDVPCASCVARKAFRDVLIDIKSPWITDSERALLVEKSFEYSRIINNEPTFLQRG